jgi:hypothetical protein
MVISCRSVSSCVTLPLQLVEPKTNIYAGALLRAVSYPAADYLHHQLTHYSGTFNRGAFPKRMSSTPDGRVLFFPRGNDILVSRTGWHGPT